MSKNRNVMMVIYDIPTKTAEERKTAVKFRKILHRHGYVPLQKSVYVKLFRGRSGIAADYIFLKREAPSSGSVYALPMSLGAFQAMKTFAGEPFNMSLFADDVIVV